MGEVFRLRFKTCVAQAEAEGKQNAFWGKAVKVAVADKNPLGIVVIFFSSEVFAAGVLNIVAGDGVAGPSAGALFSAQDVCGGAAAFHAALPGIEDGGDAGAVILDPGHIHDAADIEDHHHMGKVLSREIEQPAFVLGEVVAPLFQGVLPVFTGGATNDHQGRFCGFRRGLYGFFVKLHLRMAERPVAPPAVVGGIFFGPGGVTLGKGSIVFLPRVFEAVDEVDTPGRVHIAAAAVADIEPVELAAAENSDLLVLFERQRPIVFEQYTGFRRGLADELRKARSIIALTRCGIFLLHEPRAHMPVNGALHDLPDGFGNEIHFLFLRFYVNSQGLCHPER